MKLREFIEKNNVTGFEKINNLLISVNVEDTPYALDTDTNLIIFGTPVEFITEFTLISNILTIASIEFDISEINILQDIVY
jgi:hypothetical protein